MKKLMVAGALMALLGAGCVSSDWTCPKDAPVADVAAIGRMTGEELTTKCAFEKDGYTLPYRLHAPMTCEEGTRYPLVLFLHGAGERGNDNTVTLAHGVLPLCRYAMRHGDAFVVAPQCPEGRKWVNQDWSAKSMRRPETPSAEMVAAMALLRELVAKYPVDPSRVDVTGLSMGGFGTWDIVARMPGFFAAMMPICGGVDETTAALYRKDGRSPGIRIFHGGSDGAVSTGYSRRMDKALTAAGIAHSYTEYPGVGHNSWTQTYDNDANLDWMFGCRAE